MNLDKMRHQLARLEGDPDEVFLSRLLFDFYHDDQGRFIYGWLEGVPLLKPIRSVPDIDTYHGQGLTTVMADD